MVLSGGGWWVKRRRVVCLAPPPQMEASTPAVGLCCTFHLFSLQGHSAQGSKRGSSNSLLLSSPPFRKRTLHAAIFIVIACSFEGTPTELQIDLVLADHSCIPSSRQASDRLATTDTCLPVETLPDHDPAQSLRHRPRPRILVEQLNTRWRLQDSSGYFERPVPPDSLVPSSTPHEAGRHQSRAPVKSTRSRTAAYNHSVVEIMLSLPGRAAACAATTSDDATTVRCNP